MRWSVIVAAKNAESTIHVALKSALFGLGDDSEVLVLLDGCSDKTEEVVAGIKDARLKVFKSPTSLGRSEARNFLISQAVGEFIAVQDADDISLPWRFRTSEKMLVKHDAVFGSAILFGNLPIRAPIYLPFSATLHSDLLERVLCYRNPLVNSTAAFRRTLFSEAQVYKDVVAEDYLLWLDLVNRGASLFKTSLPLSAYRIHSGQFTKSPGYAKAVEQCPLTTSAITALQEKMLPDRVSDSSLESRSQIIQMQATADSWPLRLEEKISNHLAKLSSFFAKP